jgi:drug/metabolite transporter (DMT)-like permease
MSYFQLQHNNQDMLGYGAAMGGTLLTACNFVCMRKLRTVHFSVLIFAFSVMSAAVSAAIVPVVAEFTLPKTMEEWAYSLLVGIFGLIGQSLLALALRYMFVCLFVCFDLKKKNSKKIFKKNFQKQNFKTNFK